jgi:HEAT repeat protein
MIRESDPIVRSRLVELVGNSKNPKVIPFLVDELKNPNSEVRSWAYSSLLYFENPEAMRIAEKFKEANPNEDFL